MIRRIQNLTEQTVLIVLVVVAVSSLAFSAMSHWMNGEIAWWAWADSAFQNFSTEMMGAVLTFALFQLIVGVRNEKKNLIIQLRSKDNATALNVLEQIKEKGWLRDGTLKGANLGAANLQGATLGAANLQEATLIEANLQGANLFQANLQGADLEVANLQGALLTETNLQGAYLVEANLQGARLDVANLQGAHLQYTKLQGARLDATNLQGAHLTTAEFDDKTVLPDAVSMKDAEGRYIRDETGWTIYDKYWTPETDMTRYTNPNHRDFWQPEWVREQRE